MATIPLAGTKIPRIVLGTSALGSVAPESFVLASGRERDLRYLDAMLAAGCAAIDTAASYQLGGTERVLGEWMHSRKNRDRLFLISKGGHPYPVVQPHRLTRKALTDDLHASLRRLRTDVLDLYLLHRDDPSAPLEPILESLALFQREGRIKAWGVSNWTHDRLRALDAMARAAGVPPIAASSPHFSLVDWTGPPWKGSVTIAGDENREARAFYASSQVPVLAWAALSRGFFSGKPGTAADRIFDTPANRARRERAARLARARGRSAAQIALAYLFEQPFPVAAVVATATPERMKENLAAADLSLSTAEVAWLESGGEPPLGLEG